MPSSQISLDEHWVLCTDCLVLSRTSSIEHDVTRGNARKFASKRVMNILIRATYYIFCCRNISHSNLHNLVSILLYLDYQ